MRAILDIVLIVLQMYSLVVFATCIVSWLVAFNVINLRNPGLASIVDMLYRVTEPVFAKVRPYMPRLNGMDLAPIAVLLGIMLIDRIIVYYIYPNVI
jgi:YggT family protein